MSSYEKKIIRISSYYGLENQLVQTAEEGSELAEAALHYRRAIIHGTAREKLTTRKALIEELADTLVMIEQICWLEGFENEVIKTADSKVDRQIGRILEAKNGKK